jgi:non-ribosomal peptide synthetase component F
MLELTAGRVLLPDLASPPPIAEASRESTLLMIFASTVERCASQLAILGVLQAGAAYVPVDADDPPARAQHILFHDRLLRIGPTRLAAGATLGPTAVVLPDTKVGAGTCVCGHSVVLRGEELPPGTRWQSTPGGS